MSTKKRHLSPSLKFVSTEYKVRLPARRPKKAHDDVDVDLSDLLASSILQALPGSKLISWEI